MKRIIETGGTYFAAANSFNGFKSNFKSVFDPENYERIFILKGGPGTGKSTLMKRVAKHFSESECVITRFLCSSDPSSLDGVTIGLENKKIAIIDGTSPHMTDPEIPGACEHIINLTEALNFKELRKRKAELSALNTKKRAYYKAAYEYLRTAGEIHNLICEKIRKSKVYKEAEEICDMILGYEIFSKTDEAARDDLHLGAFGKDGYVRADIPCIEKEYLSVVGDGFTDRVVMDILRSKLIREDIMRILAYSPLTHKDIDAIITTSLIISTDNVGSVIFDTSPLALSQDKEYTELIAVYRNLLSISQSHFALASREHSELEKIYVSNIDFSYNEKCVFEINKEIGEILY